VLFKSKMSTNIHHIKTIEPGTIWYGGNVRYARVTNVTEPCGIRFNLLWENDPEAKISHCWDSKKFLQEFRKVSKTSSLPVFSIENKNRKEPLM